MSGGHLLKVWGEIDESLSSRPVEHYVQSSTHCTPVRRDPRSFGKVLAKDHPGGARSMGMRRILALAGADRARRIRAALPRDVCLEAFGDLAGLQSHAHRSGSPMGLVLAALPSGEVGRRSLQTLSMSLPGCVRLLWLESEGFGPAAEALELGGWIVCSDQRHPTRN